METVKVELPWALLRAANLDGSSLSQEAARLLALELYRKGDVSLERAAELCQTPLSAFVDFAAMHSVPPLGGSPRPLDAELIRRAFELVADVEVSPDEDLGDEPLI
jgi:predicted HTH domain antitoxin